MRQRMMLATPFWTSAEQPDFQSRFVFAQATACMRIGRWRFWLILKHGKDFQPALLDFSDLQASNTNAQPISHPFSDRSAHITASMPSLRQSILWMNPASSPIKFRNWRDC
jgi:hypothetical protein